jgi:NAD(P)-dependent dehydrogenase (short-subunit alcohol dehydrogenase family)
MSELRFDGQVAIVTGAGRGLGRAYAVLLAQRGASVVVNDLGCELDATGRSPEPANETVEQILSLGGSAIANYESVSTKDGAAGVVSAALETFGSVDIVVNNAGIQIIEPFCDTDESIVQRHVDAHVLSTLLVSQAAWPALLQSTSPRIVNTASTGMLGLDGYIAYSAAKAAIVGLTRTMALEGLSTPIRVNAIAPNAITRMVTAHMAKIPGAAVTDEMRLAMPVELVAPVVAYLCHQSCQTTGEVLAAGGGHVSRIVFAETRGVADRELTPESVAAHIEEIMDDRVTITLPDTMGRNAALAAH